jgi:hypothetical protein
MTTTELRTASSPARRRAPRGARVVGYLVAAAINAAFIWFLNVSPGWRWVAFLTEDFSRVVGVVSLSLMISLLINLVYLAVDPLWIKRLGDAVTAAVAVVVMLQLFQVFPFDFGSGWDWAHTVLRVFLAFGCIGAAIGVLANLAEMAKSLAAAVDAAGPPPSQTPRGPATP